MVQWRVPVTVPVPVPVTVTVTVRCEVRRACRPVWCWPPARSTGVDEQGSRT